LDEYAVDDHYARLDGTSMATPHVAGAAAILAAQHPDWNGEQLKSALMSTAHPIDAGVYEAGTGRVDVGRAVRQPVTASPASLSMGYVPWPHDGPAPAPKTVTYRNTGDSDVTLDLALTARDESGTAANVFHADRNQVTVPAGGTAAVTVTFDPDAGPVGLYAGRLVATAGDTVVQTTVGGYKEPERHNLSVTVTDRNGKEIPAGDEAGMSFVMSLTDQALSFFPVLPGDTLRVPPGHYAAFTIAETPVDGALPSSTTIAAPDVTVDEDTVVAMDARKGEKVTVRTDKPDAAVAAGVSGMKFDNGTVSGGFVTGSVDDLYAVPTGGDTDGFVYYNRTQLERPLVRLSVTAPESFEVPVTWVPHSPELHGTTALTAVDVGHATPAELAAHDLTGTLAVFTLGAGEEEQFGGRLAAIAATGAAAVLFRFSEQMSVGGAEPPTIPVAYTTRPAGARLAALGTASVTLTGTAFSPYRYELVFPNLGAIPSTVDYRVRDRQLATVRAKYHAMVPGGIGYLDYGTDAYGFSFGGYLWSAEVPLPVERTEYYTPDPVTWDLSVRTAPVDAPEHGFQGPDLTYRAGSTQHADWGAAVVGPSLAVDNHRFTGQWNLVAREGDSIRAELPLLSDAARHSGYPNPADYSFADTGDTSLYAGDVLVGSSGVPGGGEFTVPAGAADYRLTSVVTRDNPVWPLSTQVSGEWSFRSAHSDTPTPLPLLAVGFAPRVDLLNYAPANKKITIPVTVGRQTGATGPRPVLDSVEYSLDDGVTWVKVTARDKNGHWEVTVPNPASGFVSLRAAASDRDGNAVTQTILRAYRVK
jgi:hypothetical protein